MTKDEAITAVNSLHQITQISAQPASVHIECQKTKDKLIQYIAEKEVDPAPVQE